MNKLIQFLPQQKLIKLVKQLESFASVGFGASLFLDTCSAYTLLSWEAQLE